MPSQNRRIARQVAYSLLTQPSVRSSVPISPRISVEHLVGELAGGEFLGDLAALGHKASWLFAYKYNKTYIR